MKLDKETKEKIDNWFSKITPNELLYITEKYIDKKVLVEVKTSDLISIIKKYQN